MKERRITLNPKDQATLNRLLKKRLSAAELISLEMASVLATLAHKYKTSVSVLIDRRGKIRHSYLGTLNQITDLDAQEAREGSTKLTQQRLVIASSEDHPDRAELLALKKYQFDSLVFIHADPNTPFAKSQGDTVEFADYGQLCLLQSAAPGYSIGPITSVRALVNVDPNTLTQDIEEDLAQLEGMLKVKGKERAILVNLNGRPNSEDSLAELYRLAETAGAEVVANLSQKLAHPDPAHFIGKGKLEELRLLCEEEASDIVVVDAELSPAQARNMERFLSGKVKVIDRTELILDIFAQRARSDEGKLQVELAQLQYMSPRLVGGFQFLSKLGGGIGTRGPGETKLEVQRRSIKDRINLLKERVAKISETRHLQRRRREERSVPLVSLVGYTNAGKSSLFNQFARQDVFVQDKLFATLDPTIRQVNTVNSSFLLSDTVGFIQNLPTTLVKAFGSTLEEIGHAALLLIVVDAAHPNRFEHLAVIRGILADLKIQEVPELLVFNKADLLDHFERERLAQAFPDAHFVSAHTKDGLVGLLASIELVLAEGKAD